MAAAGARFIARAAALQRHLTSATVNSNAAVREVHGAAEAWTRAESEDVRAEAARALVRALAATPSARKARALGEIIAVAAPSVLKSLVETEGGLVQLVAGRQALLSALGHREGDAAGGIGAGRRAMQDAEVNLRKLFEREFSPECLEFRRIQPDADHALLEKLVRAEGVHRMANVSEVLPRIGPQRRLLALFHPRMPGEPLAFVYSALLTDLPARVAPILQARPESAAEESRATTAAFYSINSAHKGLQGLDLGAILIKGAMQRLQAELPALRVFATLSPVPGFASWLRATADPRAHDAVAALARDLAPLPLEVPAPLVSGASLSMTSTVQARVTYKLSHSHMGDPWLEHPGVQRMLSRLCAYYLLHAKRHTHVLDPVGHFHLRNGACLERINSLGDVSAKGLAESFGVMVNYVYSGQDLAANAERYTRQGIVVASAQVEALAAEVAI